MPVFEDVTQDMVRELDPRGNLIPLDSLIDFKRFRPFSLLLTKKRITWFQRPRYVPTDYTLLDLLEPGSSLPDPIYRANFSFKNMRNAQVEGDVDVPNTVRVKGTAGLSQSSTVELETLGVAPTDLENMMERKLSADHPFLKEMREHGENLYVVMEVVEAKQEVTLEETGNKNASFSLFRWAKVGLQKSVNDKKTVTIPKGCVLAYGVKQLRVYLNNQWDIPHIFNDSMQTFSQLKKRPINYFRSRARSPVQMTPEIPREEKLIRKKKELQDPEQKLEGALDKGQEVTLEALPKDDLLSKDAMVLKVLCEVRLKILIKSLENKILQVQLKLIKKNMEKNFLQDKEGVLLLFGLKKVELLLRELLIELSNLEVQGSGPQYTWDPEFYTFYPFLSLRQLLSKDS